MKENETRPSGLWMLALVIICALPGAVFPWTLAEAHSANPILRTLTWLYPAYTLLSAFLAWQCWRAGRQLMTWIVLILLLLTHACFYFLTFCPI